MKNYASIKFVSTAQTPDGAGGFVSGATVTLYETRALANGFNAVRTVEGGASEVNFGVEFTLYLPSNVKLGTDTPVLVDGISHAITSVQRSNYSPFKSIVRAVRRDG